jgi:penicillin-binding protein 2
MVLKKEKDQNKVFTRRAFVIGGIQGTLLCVIGSRLAWLQITQGSRYKMLSDQNRINMKIIPPSRGQIVDRFGVPLAVNNQNFRVLVIPEQTQDLEKSLRALQKTIAISDENIKDVLKQAKKSSKFVPIEIKDDLTWDDVATIEVNLPDLPGLSTDVGERRTYPMGEATAHLIGYVGAVSESEIGEDPLLRLPGFKIGKSGIEKTYDQQLRGEGGASEVEVNVVGREVRELKTKPGKPGQRIKLTIDGELQRFTQATLAVERSASAVVMDAHTGAIYALASSPSFDPNSFSGGISAALWEELMANPAHPLINKAIAGIYPPASTFKMVTALAGMRAGIVGAGRRTFCSGVYRFGNTKFHCWKKAGHGSVNVVEALKYSCDTYFYDLATEVGIEAIAETARMMGLGGKLGFELSEERGGLVPDKKWKAKQKDSTWHQGETIVTSIGQGALQTTPLQLAVMMARFVNGGREVKPWITEDQLATNKMPQNGWPKMDINPKFLEMIKKGTDAVANEQGGTAYGARIQEPGMEMGGKTGTAQVQRITMAQRNAGVKNEDLSWEQRHHALYVGYAPVLNPRYVCSVVVEHGIGGARTAAPMAHDILLAVQKRNSAGLVMMPQNTADVDAAKTPAPAKKL